MNAIDYFRCGVVLVIEDEELEHNIQRGLVQRGKVGHVTVVKVPKSQGISSTRLTADEQENSIFNAYQDYFRGKHYQAFSTTNE